MGDDNVQGRCDNVSFQSDLARATSDALSRSFTMNIADLTKPILQFGRDCPALC